MMTIKMSNDLEYQIGKLQGGMDLCQDIPRFLILFNPKDEDVF